MPATTTTTPRPSSPSDDSTAPSTPPSTASSISPQVCASPSCPINHPHDRGLYLHSCRVPLSIASRRIFAPSAPPPDVLAAYERCINKDGTKTDEETWVTFHEVHVEPLLGHTDGVWRAPVPMIRHDGDLEIGESADPDVIEADSRVDDCRHPFGLLNPPGKIWEAHQRLVLGVGDLHDQEAVEAFAAKNAYYGKGLGQYESMSRRFEVRRPRYPRSLAKKRRIEKELEAKRSKS